jgi:hypothetical protein
MNLLKPAQAVIFSMEMEPIVSIDMKPWFWDYLFTHSRLSFAVMQKTSYSEISEISPDMVFELPPTVTVNAIPFKIKESLGLMLMTYDDVNALLLESSFLPGQSARVEEEKKKAFAQGFIKALYEMRER